jgi:hypothetical protein
MKAVLLVVSGLCFLVSGRASVIYSTLGSGVPTYDASHGYLVTGSSLPPGYGGLAAPFTPSANYEITLIDLGLLYLGGTNSGVVGLYNDSFGVPGSLLGSWIVSGVPNPYAEVAVLASGRVQAGVQYWISVLPSGNDTDLGWAFNSQNITGIYAGTRNGTTYSTDIYTLPAFDVLGNPVPEHRVWRLPRQESRCWL